MQRRIAGVHLICTLLLCGSLVGAWMTSQLQNPAHFLTRSARTRTAWRSSQYTRHTAAAVVNHVPRVLSTRTSLWNAEIERGIVETQEQLDQEQLQQQLDRLRQQQRQLPEVAANNATIDASEDNYDWVLNTALDAANQTTEISDEDVRLAYECFYNISVAPSHEGMQILMAHTNLFVFKNVTELYERSLELASEEHVANLSGGFAVVLEYVESFAESWGKLMDKYHTLLAGAVNATQTSIDTLDRFMDEHKVELAAPGFLRYLATEQASVQDQQLQTFLQYLQARVVAQEEVNHPEEIKMIARLVSVADQAQRSSELEYFIRSAKDPLQRADAVLQALKSALDEANGLDLMTGTGLEVIKLLQQLSQVTESVAASLQQPPA